MRITSGRVKRTRRTASQRALPWFQVSSERSTSWPTALEQALKQSQGATSLQGAVRNLPGVTLGSAEGSSIGNNINLNGGFWHEVPVTG